MDKYLAFKPETVNYDELQKRAAMLQMSPAFSKAARFASGFPLDVSKTDETRTALVTCVVDVTQSIDQGNIEFKSTDAEAMLFGLLAVAMLILSNGNKIQFEEVRAQ